MFSFEWDDHKNKSNQDKHKIAFEDAADVFNDKDRLEFESDKNGETGYLTIGKAFQAIIRLWFIQQRNLITYELFQQDGPESG